MTATLYDAEGFSRPPAVYSRATKRGRLNPRLYEGLLWEMRADGTITWKYQTRKGNTDRQDNGRKSARLVPIPGAFDEASAISGWKELSGQVEQGKTIVASGKHTATDVWNVLKERIDRELKSGKRSLSSWKTTEGNWRLHLEPRIGTKAFAKITTDDWAAVFAELSEEDMAQNTQMTVKSVVNLMYRTADRRGWASVNTYAKLETHERPQKQKGAAVLVRPSDTVKMINEVNPLYKIMLIVLACTGLRVSELCGLRWSDIDWDNEILTVNGQLGEHPITRKMQWLPVLKTETSYRSVLLLPLALKALRTQRQIEWAKGFGKDDDFVFTTSTGERLKGEIVGPPTGGFVSQANFRNRGVIAVGLKALGKHITPHDLRHTTASLFAEAGISTAAAAKMMGHTEKTYIDIYSHAFQDEIEFRIARTKLAAIGFGADTGEIAV